jgi:hypothetical protein
MATATTARTINSGLTVVGSAYPALNIRSGINSAVKAPSKKSKTPYGDMLLDITNQQQQLYDQLYRPLNQRLIQDVNSTAIVDQAKQEASAVDSGKYIARSQRQQLRYGLNATPQEQEAINYQQQLGGALTSDGNINNARVKQQERNEQLRSELVNISRGISAQAMDSATNAAGAESTRKSTNANIQAQNTAAEKGVYGAIGSMALMALMMM